MAKQGLVITGVILIISLGLFAFIRFGLGGPEDTWLCQDNQWVKHGQPANPPPASGCGPIDTLSSDSSSGQLIGGDTDEYGCLISAGYSWCELKHKCLRVWEEPCDLQISPSAIPSSDTDIESAIIRLFVDKYQKDPAQITISITDQDQDHARGTVTFLPQGPGNSGLFLAARVNNQWQLVFDGNGSFSCAQVAPFNFPSSMISDCY